MKYEINYGMAINQFIAYEIWLLNQYQQWVQLFERKG